MSQRSGRVVFASSGTLYHMLRWKVPLWTDYLGYPSFSFSMFNLWAGEGSEFRTCDTAQGFLFLSPDTVSSLSDLVCTLIGNMHNTIGVSVQQVTRTDAHTG